MPKYTATITIKGVPAPNPGQAQLLVALQATGLNAFPTENIHIEVSNEPDEEDET